MKVVYGGIEITYDERENVWRFELRGRERSAESLAKAKETIDKPEPNKKANTFERRKAYFREYGSFKVVEVTSVAEPGYRSGDVFWILNGKNRSKEAGYKLWEYSAENTATVEQIKSLENQVKNLNEQIKKLEEGMGRIVVPKEVAA